MTDTQQHMLILIFIAGFSVYALSDDGWSIGEIIGALMMLGPVTVALLWTAGVIA